MRKNRIIYFLLLIVLFWIMIMYNSWQTELIFKTGVLVPVIIGIINFLMARKIKVYFDEQEEFCQREDSIKKYIMIDNITMFPAARIELKVEIKDYFGHKEKRTIVANSEPYTIRNFGMDMTFNHYGIMSVRITQMRVYDFFFLTVFKKKINIETMIYIFPDMEDRMDFIIKSCQYGTEEDENEESSSGNRGVNRGEIVEIDEYHEGDDIRNIHWKLSSKSDNLMVKHYSNAVDEKVHIHVDTLVDSVCRYARCDKMLGVIHSVVNACIAGNIDFDIVGYGQDGAFETDLTNILSTIRVREKRETPFLQILQTQKKQGTNIYITTESVGQDILSEDIVYIKLRDETQEQENSDKVKKQYFLENNTLLHIEVKEQDEKANNDKFFIEPYNDKIRKHKKIKHTKSNFKYMALQSFVALLAAGMAVFSIYDVMFYGNGEILIPLVTVSLFILIHFGLNVLSEGMDEKRIGTIRNIIIFGGYLVILILGGVFFIFDGVSDIIDAFNMDIIVSVEDYGFFEYTTTELNWLLVLVTYAVADVIYNFCMEFVLPVHILIVIPLISISMIVGYVPPMYVVFFGLLYFPVIFAVNSCIIFGKKKKKKYLSDDYPYTANIAYSSGITTIIATMLTFILVVIHIFWGGYHRPVWMKECKSVISSMLEEGSLEGGIRILSDLFKPNTVLTANERGQLDDTVKVSYTGETVLRVTTSQMEAGGIYLKSFAGTNYEGDSWKERSSDELKKEEEYLQDIFDEVGYTEQDKQYLDQYFTEAAAFREKYTSYFARCQGMNFYFVSTQESTPLYNIEIRSMLDNDTNIYRPYYATPRMDGAFGSDGYDYLAEPVERYVMKYIVYDVGNTLNTNAVREKYGDYPYNALPNPNWEGYSDYSSELTRLASIEKRYAEYIEENYTDVPKELESLKANFSNVYTVYQGRQVNLVNGDYQYRTLGYEPYVQYVRRYFSEHDFTYNINITRNSEKDFISDFMMRRTGYCIHFASAAVMMFRSMGIPARYAEGYFADTEDVNKKIFSADIQYDVTDQSAHAWVEIYQEGFGWVPVEVTPGTQNFIVTHEEVTSADIPQNTTAPDSNQQTSSGSNEATTSSDSNQTTTAKKDETKKTDENPEKSMSPEAKAMIRGILFVLAAVGIVLVRYQILSSRRIKRLENKSRIIRMNEIDDYLREVVKLFKVSFDESDINEKKAKTLFDSLPAESLLNQEEISEAFSLLDKLHYAPKGSMNMEEVDKLYHFIIKYGQIMYEQGKVHEKFIYKYIKCLYLKTK